MTPKQIAEVKYQFYKNIRERVEELTGADQLELKKYRKKYEQEIKNLKWSGVHLKEFEQQMVEADFIFVGDFHAHAQSTRTFLRLVRHLKKYDLILGLECFYVENQNFLDLYLEGKLSEKDFLSKIEWKKNWGYPFDFWRPLLKFCIQSKIKIVGLNSLKKKKLSERDNFSAQILSQLRKKYLKSKILIQYGDFHLSKNHLIKSLKVKLKKINYVTLFQSPETLYFDLAFKGINTLQFDFYRANKNQWAILSLLPWVKWQDYLMYLEAGFDKKIKMQEVDYLDYVSEHVNLISKIYDLNISNDELSVFSIQDESFYDQILKLPLFSKKFYQNCMLNQISFYSPELKAGFLAKPSINHVARVAAGYILYKVNILNEKFHINPIGDRLFYKRIWMEMLSYFFSKSLNPKKKTDSLEDIRMALKNQNFTDKGRDSLVLSLEQKLNEFKYSSSHEVSLIFHDKLRKTPDKVNFVATQMLGQILGEKLYQAQISNQFNLKKSKYFLLNDQINDKNFYKVYYEKVEIINSWSDDVSSKFKQF